MNDYKHGIIAAGRDRLNSPFRHHFKPENFCDGGKVTIDACMERGLGKSGQYDCSGLVIASLCQVLGIDSSEWPRDYRHSKQLATLEDTFASDVGDVATFYQEGSPGVHLGILVAKNTVIHASELKGAVTEGKVLGKMSRVGIIPSGKLLELGFDVQRKNQKKKTTER